MALIAAFALGYCLHPTAGPVVGTAAGVAEKRPAPLIFDRCEEAKVAALRLQVQNLEARLADSRKNEEIAVSNAIASVEALRRDRPPPPGGPGRERLEELKKRDPERFAQITNRLAKMHQERRSRQGFLDCYDGSKFKGTVVAPGIYEKGVIKGTKYLTAAYKLGLNVK